MMIQNLELMNIQPFTTTLHVHGADLTVTVVRKELAT